MPQSAAEKTWENCLTRLSDRISSQSFHTWFAPITALSIEQSEDDAELTLAVPNAFHTEWLESHYAAVLRKVAADVVGRNTLISYEIAPENDADPSGHELVLHPRRAPAHPHRAESVPGPGHSSSPQRNSISSASSSDGGAPSYLHHQIKPSPPQGLPQRAISGAAAPAVHVVSSRLKPEYTFESFIEGDCNRLARSAAVAISQNPGGTSFNPFMVYGGVGLGKTHIVQAIGNYATSNRLAERIVYVSSEQFTSQFVRSIQENRVSDFSNFYRQIDLLIVDDVQFFGGKEKTQEEFFHVFNELHQSGKQIILCADRPPAEISGIEERLLSRFRWGLSADIQPPDLETRIAILHHKASSHDIEIVPEVLEFVAERIKANIRQLEGALLRLAAQASFTGRDIDLESAKETLRDMIDDYHVRLEIEDIQRAVAQYYEITTELLSAKTRKREIVTARHVAMYFSKLMTTHSLKSIGLRFGGRDHSTVIHACNTVEDRMELEPAFREEIEDLRQKLDRQGPARAHPVRPATFAMA